MSEDYDKARKLGQRSYSKCLLEGKYPYLEKHPWLLPVAWGERIITYIGKRGKDHTDPAVSLKLGQERVALLRRYGIIE